MRFTAKRDVEASLSISGMKNASKYKEVFIGSALLMTIGLGMDFFLPISREMIT